MNNDIRNERKKYSIYLFSDINNSSMDHILYLEYIQQKGKRENQEEETLARSPSKRQVKSHSLRIPFVHAVSRIDSFSIFKRFTPTKGPVEWAVE